MRELKEFEKMAICGGADPVNVPARITTKGDTTTIQCPAGSEAMVTVQQGIVAVICMKTEPVPTLN